MKISQEGANTFSHPFSTARRFADPAAPPLSSFGRAVLTCRSKSVQTLQRAPLLGQNSEGTKHQLPATKTCSFSGPPCWFWSGLTWSFSGPVGLHLPVEVGVALQRGGVVRQELDVGSEFFHDLVVLTRRGCGKADPVSEGGWSQWGLVWRGVVLTRLLHLDLWAPAVAGLRLSFVVMASQVADHVGPPGDGDRANHAVVVGHVSPRPLEEEQNSLDTRFRLMKRNNHRITSSEPFCF